MEPAVAAAGRAQVPFDHKPGVGVGFDAAQIRFGNREHNAIEPVHGKAQGEHLFRYRRAYPFPPVGFLPNQDEVFAGMVGGRQVREARVANQRVGLLQVNAEVEAFLVP